jgi:hypothetical protein
MKRYQILDDIFQWVLKEDLNMLHKTLGKTYSMIYAAPISGLFSNGSPISYYLYTKKKAGPKEYKNLWMKLIQIAYEIIFEETNNRESVNY